LQSKEYYFFDKGFAGEAGKTLLINSSPPPLGRGQGEGLFNAALIGTWYQLFNKSFKK